MPALNIQENVRHRQERLSSFEEGQKKCLADLNLNVDVFTNDLVPNLLLTSPPLLTEGSERYTTHMF